MVRLTWRIIMQGMLIVALIALGVSGSVAPLPDDAPLLTDEEIEQINASGLWVAEKSLIEGKTLGDLRRHRRPHSLVSTAPEYNWGALLDYVTLPTSFDSRTQWPGCINGVQDQGDCAASWAMAATDALSDRFCIAARTKVLLSPQYLISCESNGYGCDGGQMDDAWSFLYANGAPTVTCVPFVGDSTSCPARCGSGSSITVYKPQSPKMFIGNAAIQAAIAASGSVETCFSMYSDFLAYKSGVYAHTSGSLIGQECLRLVGWGTQGSLNYWIGAAYYGTSWGQSGFFYMKTDQLGQPPTAQASNPAS